MPLKSGVSFKDFHVKANESAGPDIMVPESFHCMKGEKNMRKRIRSLLVALAMVLTLLPTTALATATTPAQPQNLQFEVGQEYQTLPCLDWEDNADEYQVVASKDGSLVSGGCASISWSLDINPHDYDNGSTISCDKYTVTPHNYDGGNDYQGTSSELDCDVQITNNISASSVTAVHNTATLDNTTYHLYTISHLPADTTVIVEESTQDGTSDSFFETNQDGVLVFYDADGYLGLDSGTVSNDYYLIAFTDTSVDETTVRFTQTTYPISFDFNKTWSNTQTLTFSNSGTQTVYAGDSITNTAVNNRTDGGSIIYYDNSAGSRVDQDSGEVTALLPYELYHNSAVIYAFAAATDNYPAAIASYGLTITDLAEQTMSWSNSDGITATYGGTVTGKTATNSSENGGAITYSSSVESVATVNANTGAVTIVGAGSTTITATAAAVTETYCQTSISYPLTVAKKQVTASYDGTITKTYDGTSAVKVSGDAVTQLDLTVPDLVGNDTLTVELNNPVYASADAGAGISVTGDLSVTGTGSDNYQVTPPSVTGTITKATPTADDFQITLPSAPLYVGDSTTATIASRTGLTGMGAVTVKYDNNTTEPSAAGTYAVTFDVADGMNYAAATGLSAGSLTIYNKMTAAAAATINSDDDASLVNTGHYTVSAPVAVTGRANAYTVAVRGTSALQSYASADPGQGTGAWIGLLLTASENNEAQGADSLYWSADGSTWTSLNGEAALAANDGGNGTNAFAFWMNTTSNTSVTRYIATDNSGSDKLELTFNFTAYTPPYTGSTGGGSPASAAAPTVSGSTATTTATARTGSNGMASASVTQAQVSDAITAAQRAAQSTGETPRVEIQVEGAADAGAVDTTLPASAVQALVTDGMDSLTLSSGIGDMTFDAQALAAIAGAASGDVTISAAQVENSTLSDEAAQVVGDRPVYDFSVASGGSTISQFGGAVTVSVPYTPAAGEDANAIVAYYINADGVPELMQNCYYDVEADTLVFTTTHFSAYAVGYHKVNFSDVSDSDWYADAVGFIAARNITSGTSKTTATFSPDATLTRGQFITLLMRAYGIEPDTNSSDNFSDAGNTYYTGYLAAAKQLKISNGVGNNKFAPEQAVTRQEMFTLLYNVLKTIDQLPEGTSGKTLSDFADSASISSYAQEGMAYFVKAGAVSGNNGYLLPEAASTRAQMAQVLYNLLSK